MKVIFVIFSLLLSIFFSNNLLAKTTWHVDKNLSEIIFELPVLFSKNVKGSFSEFQGYVIIDVENKINNKAIFSVEINSVRMNYEKYIELLLSEVFFDAINYPFATIDTKKFSFENEEELIINADLQIKKMIKNIPISIKIFYLTKNLVQVKTDFVFSRTAFNLGKDNWLSTIILSDKIHLKTNLFFIKE